MGDLCMRTWINIPNEIKLLLLLLILADRRELATLNNQQVVIDLEEKSGQWLGGTVHSTGTNGKAMVQFLFYHFFYLLRN